MASAVNQLDLGICYLQHLDEGQFKIARLPQTRMGLLHDKRHFDFSAGTPGWETLATLPPRLSDQGDVLPGID
ncbi:LysR family transcriptional regulator [Klebsiella pneumoniae]|uniref:LysR family transcriptional regulator n=1 Tax=Klebsiella pneumoniae TaxID=573 RepID=A0A3S4G9U1_KLEPN|nr:LysR family transcriptional regulator [Klebsiella pneumoniae]